jgi:rubrerythrin
MTVEDRVENSIPAWLCLRCDHLWPKREETPPVKCPSCHSPYWNRERTRKPQKATPLK